MTRTLPAGVESLVRRVFGGIDTVERTSDGVSTEVCRIRRGDETFYLRLAEAEGLDMAPEVEAHERLRALGVHVAEIVYYEPCAEECGRSVAFTSEVPGISLIDCGDERISRRVARAAGRDLALLNSIETDGWGWVARDGRPGIRGVHQSRKTWLVNVIGAGAREHLDAALGSKTLAALECLITEESRREHGEARLAHGDFDVSQIFYADGAYTGIIDLGEIQGADPHYDLAHFLVHDREQNEYALLSDVLAGYADIADVADEDRLTRTGVLLTTFRLSHALARWGQPALGHPHIRWMSGRIIELLGRIER